VRLLPTGTFPKFKVVGLATRLSVTPVPESGIDMADCKVVIETSPVMLPAVVGANVMLNVVLCPPDKLRGREDPLMLNPAPLMVASIIFEEELLEFVMVTI